MAQEPDLEQRLRQLAEQARRKSLSPNEGAILNHELGQLASRLTKGNLPKDEVLAALDSIGEIQKSLREKLQQLKDAERTKELIDGPVKIVLMKEEYKPDDRPRYFGGTDEVIYAISDAKRVIVRASEHSIQDLVGLTISPDKERLAFMAESGYQQFRLHSIFDPKQIGIYVVNIDGTNFNEISGRSIGIVYGKSGLILGAKPNSKLVRYSYDTPEWLSESTLQFQRDEYQEWDEHHESITGLRGWFIEHTITIKVALDEKNEPSDLN